MGTSRILAAALMACATAWAAGAAGAAGTAGTAAPPAVDLNQATRAEIEAVRGVGVELTDRLLHARLEGPFRDWPDLRRRVKGVSQRALAGLNEARFRIHGQAPPGQN